MKCLFKYQWVKLPRNQLPSGKGIMGAWARLASRAAFRNGQATYCGHINEVKKGSWAGGVVGLKSILGIKNRQKAMDIEATISPHFSLVNADLRSTAAPRGVSSSVSSWRVAPFYSWEKEKSSRFKIEMAAPDSWCLCCVVVTQQFLFWRRMADYSGSFPKSFGYYKTSRVN